MMLFQWRKARETYEEAISMWREYKEKEVLCAIIVCVSTGIFLGHM